MTQERMSHGQRLMYPLFPALAVVLAVRCFGSSSEFFYGLSHPIAQFMPMVWWGALYVVVFVLLVAGAVRKSPALYGTGLAVLILAMTVWSVALFAASVLSNDLLLAPWVWPAAVGYAAFTLMTTLNHSREGRR